MFCNNCGRENTGDANFCKHCGAPLSQSSAARGKPKKKRVFLIVGIIAAVLVVFVISASIGVCLVIRHTIQEQREALEIINSSMTYDEFGYAEVTGRVRNNGDSEIPGCFVKAKFYDSEDNLVDTGMDVLYHMSAGEEARFTILCGKEGVVRYEVYVG